MSPVCVCGTAILLIPHRVNKKNNKDRASISRPGVSNLVIDAEKNQMFYIQGNKLMKEPLAFTDADESE